MHWLMVFKEGVPMVLVPTDTLKSNQKVGAVPFGVGRGSVTCSTQSFGEIGVSFCSLNDGTRQ
jgi:hypothetical protein